MTRKDFAAIAAILREEDEIARQRTQVMEVQAARTSITMLGEKLADYFETVNPNFSRVKFFMAVYPS